MEPKDKKSEVHRLWNLSAGYSWILDSQRLLYACLTNVNPRDAHLMEFNGSIPSSHADMARLLYKLVVNSTELEGLAAERICSAIEEFLLKTLGPQELADFKKRNPRKEPKQFSNILEEIESEQ